ncbi:MAG TPA: hydroxyacid dehydrogenase [Clostridiales bacterium]|nr:hydroxyacid dehydrogenase [Clostridiales bacterium]
MKKKGIWLLVDTNPEQLDMIKKAAPEYELFKARTQEEIDFPLEDVEIVYGWNKLLCKPLLSSSGQSLKWIQAMSAGVDYMDFEYLKDNNILLSNGSGIHPIPVSESVFGMILAFTRGIFSSIKYQRNKQWEEISSMTELPECTMMIVGTGQIGTQVGKLAKAFGMRTIGVNRSGRSVEYMDEVVLQGDMVNHFHKADIIVDILPLTDLTHQLFKKDIFSKMKDNTIFINVGRGPTVNTLDLIEALNNGKLAYAGLDVFEEEPLAADNPLWDMDNVLITPHISGFARHFKKRIFEIFHENLQAYVDGQELPRNKVDYDRSY